jgi:hypothetical protein
MRELLILAAGFAAGYWVVKKAAPVIQAKIEAMDLDAIWEIWDTEEWM